MASAHIIAHAKQQKRKREKELKELEKRQEGEVNRWFLKFDTQSDGILSRDEVKALLKEVAGTEPSQGALDMAMAFGASPEDGSTPRSDGITKKHCGAMVAKVSLYMKEQGKIDPMFDSVDADSNGVLDEHEMLKLLKMCVAGDPGIDTEKISEEDAKMIVLMCDKSNDGGIDRSEMMFACITWKKLVQVGSAPFQKKPASSACVLL